MTKIGPLQLDSMFVRLRPDASVERLPVDDSFWARLASGKLGSFKNEYLVALFEFDAPWSTWEMHPNGDEVVVLLDGAVTFVLEMDDSTVNCELAQSGAYVLVPKGVWHTVRPSRRSRMLFITAGEGTEHRPV